MRGGGRSRPGRLGWRCEEAEQIDCTALPVGLAQLTGLEPERGERREGGGGASRVKGIGR